MKKITALFTALALVLGMCACSAKVEEPIWQEQFDLGVQYLSEGNYDEAILAFTAAIEIDPKQADAYEKLANAYWALGDTETALQALKDGYAATEDTKLQAAIAEVSASEPNSSPKLPQELSADPIPTATSIPEAELYPIDHIGMTIDSLTQLWGADYQTSEYFYAGGARPIYYEDGRTSIVFFVLDAWNELDNNYGVHGDDEIILIRVPQIIDEVAPGIPTRATYLQLVGTGYHGELFEYDPTDLADIGENGETAEYHLDYSPEISIIYFWYGSDDPKTTQAKNVEIWRSAEPTSATTPALTPVSTPSPILDFQIENGVLIKYVGPGGAVTIPDGVTSIGNRAFSGCDSLASITIPDGVTSINSGAFSRCDNLKSITIPYSVTSISEDTFWGCSNLTSITIPDNVTDIGNHAFYGCYSLNNITIPSSVTKIGEDVFSGCNSLNSITVAPDNPNYIAVDGVLFDKGQAMLLKYPGGKTESSYTIPAGVARIDRDAFYGCDSLNSIAIPNSVTRLGEGAFEGCDSLTDVYYSGTEEEWNFIIMGDNRSGLQNDTIHFNS